MQKQNTWFILDFDSTFTQVEAMEELAAISLKNDPDKEDVIEKIKQLTDMAMDGKMPFNKSLKARIALLSAKKYHLNMLVNRLRKKVSVSFARNKSFFKTYEGRVLIVSGGFKEFIEPVVKSYNISADCVYANTFTYDKKNNIIGADEENFLAQDNGKVKLLKHLKLKGDVYVIGDGFTDYQIREAGLCKRFFAFTENIKRPLVIEKADAVAPSLDEILFSQNLPMALSYPKSRIKALLIGEETYLAEQYLKNEGYQIEKLAAKSNKIGNSILKASLALLAPSIQIADKDLDESKLVSLSVWGEDKATFNVDLATKKGIAIFNSPFANTRNIAELALHALFSFSKNTQAKNGLGFELIGKKLGIVGYENSGSLLSVLAQNLGMEVSYYDEKDRASMGNAVPAKNLIELLKRNDFIVVCPSQTSNNKALLGQKELNQINPKAYLVHLASEESLDMSVVEKLLSQNKLNGFYIDCLHEDTLKKASKFKNTLSTLQNRNKTSETQENIAKFISQKMIEYMNTGNTSSSVNIPNIQLPELQNSHRFIHIHHNKSGILAKINSILGKHKINITGQYLKTNDSIGYVITDVAKQYDKEVIEELKAISETIRFRVLY